MGDMYVYDNSTCSSSSSSRVASLSSRAGAPDDISLFFHQFLRRSSSSSSSSLMAHNTDSFLSSPSMFQDILHPCQSPLVKDGISVVEFSDRVNSPSGVPFSSAGSYFSANVRGSAANVSSSSAGASETEADEYDCESEEGLEALVDESPAKPIARRSSSKRSRAAEAHNLSEKRRRSRINEKMKALQNLIPNSNKTVKASMLDEAIEYLKQLQLQVQMLTMRNGISLHPMCLPGELQPIQLSQMRVSFGEENGSLNMDMPSALPANQETPAQTMFSLPNQCPASGIINSETSFGLESAIQAHLGVPFRLHTSSKEICGQDMLRHQQLNVNHSEMNPLGGSHKPTLLNTSKIRCLQDPSVGPNLKLEPRLQYHCPSTPPQLILRTTELQKNASTWKHAPQMTKPRRKDRNIEVCWASVYS